jgi:hypothetical protein
VAHEGGLVEDFVVARGTGWPVLRNQISSGLVYGLRPQMAAMSEPPMPVCRTACHSSRSALASRTTVAPDGKTGGGACFVVSVVLM